MKKKIKFDELAYTEALRSEWFGLQGVFRIT